MENGTNEEGAAAVIIIFSSADGGAGRLSDNRDVSHLSGNGCGETDIIFFIGREKKRTIQMGNNAPTRTVYVCQKNNEFLFCPNHMPLALGGSDKEVFPVPDHFRVYEIETTALPGNSIETILKSTHTTKRTKVRTVTERDIEIMEYLFQTPPSLDSDDDEKSVAESLYSINME